jgi:hypothetical protein
MTKLKFSPVVTEKPVKVSIEIPATLYRDLKIYAEILGESINSSAKDPADLIIPMIAQFINGDKTFNKPKRSATLSQM